MSIANLPASSDELAGLDALLDDVMKIPGAIQDPAAEDASPKTPREQRADIQPDAERPTGLPDHNSLLPSGIPPTMPPGYEFIRALGSGGMGVVREAHQRSLNRRVALKMIHDAALTAPQVRLRFKSEAEAMARLQHPNIVQIYEVGEHDGKPFFSMEYIQGPSLKKYLESTTLSPMEAAGLVEKLARGMDYVHEQGIIHRDLKPANVLLVSEEFTLPGSEAPGGKPSPLRTPKITDFGLAKAEGQTGLTVSGQIFGTLSYMSPEQAAGETEEIDRRTDVYALGAILYELLVGAPPFHARTLGALLQRFRETEPIPPRRFNPHVPYDLETICLRCLEKNPGKRVANAGDLAEHLRRLREGERCKLRSVTATERIWKWCGRKPASAALVLLVIVGAFLVGALITTWIDNDQIKATSKKAQFERENAERISLMLIIEKAINEGNKGSPAEALLLWAEALDLAHKRNNKESMRLARMNLDAWMKQLSTDKTFSAPVRAIGAQARKRVALWSLEGESARTYSPDGKIILTAGGKPSWEKPGGDDARNKARLWNAETENLIWESVSHAGEMTFVAFSPKGDIFVTVNTPNPPNVTSEIHVWNTESRERIFKPIQLSAHVSAVVISPDGKTLALATEDNTIRQLNPQTGDSSGVSLAHRKNPGIVRSMAFSPDSKTVVAALACPVPEGMTGGLALIWDAQEGKLLHTLKHGTAVNAVTFSPDGRTILTGSGNQEGKKSGGEVRLLDASNGQEIGTPARQKFPVIAVSFSGNQKIILVGCLVTEEIEGIKYRREGWVVHLLDADSLQSIGPSQYIRGLIHHTRFDSDGTIYVPSSESARAGTRWSLPVPVGIRSR